MSVPCDLYDCRLKPQMQGMRDGSEGNMNEEVRKQGRKVHYFPIPYFITSSFSPPWISEQEMCFRVQNTLQLGIAGTTH